MYISKLLMSYLTKLKDNKDSNLGVKVFTLSFVTILLFFAFCLVSGKTYLFKSYLSGVIATLIYFRMQLLFGETFYRKEFIYKVISIFTSGRIFLLAAFLYVVVKRPDVFNLFSVLGGVVVVHLISFSVFIYDSFRITKKNIAINY